MWHSHCHLRVFSRRQRIPRTLLFRYSHLRTPHFLLFSQWPLLRLHSACWATSLWSLHHRHLSLRHLSLHCFGRPHLSAHHFLLPLRRHLLSHTGRRFFSAHHFLFLLRSHLLFHTGRRFFSAHHFLLLLWSHLFAHLLRRFFSAEHFPLPLWLHSAHKLRHLKLRISCHLGLRNSNLGSLSYLHRLLHASLRRLVLLLRDLNLRAELRWHEHFWLLLGLSRL